VHRFLTDKSRCSALFAISLPVITLHRSSSMFMRSQAAKRQGWEGPTLYQQTSFCP
jgi:hypothetical protein